jgi:hypothetical protein
MTLYVHDCDKCTNLGEYRGHDLYHCEQGGLPTVIARFGNDGAAYKSGMVFKTVDRELGIAARRAIDRKLPMDIKP